VVSAGRSPRLGRALAWIASAIMLVGAVWLVPLIRVGARSEPVADAGVCRSPMRALRFEADDAGAAPHDLATALLLDGAARRWQAR
jgi:hypothetical protein